MGHKFEFYNHRGDLTREGKITNTKVAAMMRDDDYRYIIRDDEYPYAIVKEGFFKKSRVVDSKEEIGAFSVAKHDEVEFILNQEIKDIEYYINDESIDFQRNGSLVIVPNTPGTHKVVNVKTKEQVWFRVKDLKTLEGIKTITDNKITEDLIADALEKYEETDLSIREVLVDLLKNGTTENLLHYQRLMTKFESIYNKAIKNETRSTWAIENNFDCKVISNGEINKIALYELQRDRKIYKKTIKIEDEIAVVLDQYKIYLIEGYNGNLFVSSRVVSAVPAGSRTEKWKEEKLNEERMNYLIQRGKISSSGIPEEIEEEIHLISTERMISTRYGAPNIIDNDEEVFFEFEDHFLSADFNETIYLCLATKKEFISQKYWAKIEIERSEVSLKTFDSGIDREETYFVWIENHLGDKVSEINVLFPKELSEDSSATLLDFFVQRERETLTERVINAKKGQFERLITDYYAALGDSANRVKRLTDLVGELFKFGTWDTAYTIFEMIYDMLTKNDIKIDSFFESSLVLSIWTRRMTIPNTRRDFILVVHSFNEYTKTVTKQVISNPLYFDVEEDYAIIQFIDLNENVSSHYAFVGGKGKNPIQLNRGLEIEVFDDVYVRHKK